MAQLIPRLSQEVGVLAVTGAASGLPSANKQWGLCHAKNTSTPFPIAFTTSVFVATVAIQNYYSAGMDAPSMAELTLNSFKANWGSGNYIGWIVIGI